MPPGANSRERPENGSATDCVQSGSLQLCDNQPFAIGIVVPVDLAINVSLPSVTVISDRLILRPFLMTRHLAMK